MAAGIAPGVVGSGISLWKTDDKPDDKLDDKPRFNNGKGVSYATYAYV